MNIKTKKILFGILTPAFATALSFAVYTVARTPVSASATGEWDKYEVITDGNGFAGVNIKEDTSGTFSAVIPSDAATFPAVTGFNSGFAMLTFELEPFKMQDYTGILIQLDRTHAAANTGPRLFLEGDGILYGFNSGAARGDIFIEADGTATTWQNETGVRYTFKSGKCGTLYVPFSVMMQRAGTATEETVLNKLHYALDLRTSGWYGDTRPTAFGTIAAVKVDGDDVTVKKLLGVADLTYSADASDETADVNLGDMSKGTKVYARHTISGSWIIDEYPDRIAEMNSVWSVSRMPIGYKVNYVNGEGETIRDSETFTSAYDVASGAYTYEITPPAIKGYAYVSANPGLAGTFREKGIEITLTYEALQTPVLTGKYVDGTGNRIAADRELPSVYDFDAEHANYSLETPKLLGYEYVSADLPLTGTFTEDTTITFTFKRAENAFSNYDVVYDDSGNFVGVNLKNSLSGGLAVNINNYNAAYGYALTTVELGELDPFESTGFLIKVKRLGLTGMSQVRMYLEDQHGNFYRLFTSADDRAQAGDSVLITPDGKVGSVTNDAANWRHAFQLSTDGTIYIPWELVSTVKGEGIGTAEGNLPIPEGTVFTKFHFGRETRFETTVGKPIVIGTIGVVYANDYNVIADEVIDLAKLTYTDDASDTTADVNLADYTKGKVVHMDRWLEGTHDAGDPTLLPEIMELVDWTRMPPQIVLRFVDEAGNKIKADALADAVYAPGGSVYDITPPEIAGYDFVSADKELSGVADNDFEITLTYKKTVYTITLEFVDTNGVTIKESRTVQAEFGEYIELKADDIEGYIYVEATSGLSFTVMGAKTIRLTYQKDVEKGCSGAVSWGGAAIVLLLAATTVCLHKKKSGD